MDIPTTPPAEDLLSHTLAFCGDCLNREDYTAAWQALCRAVSLAPQRPDILSHRGRLALFLKDSGTAQRDFAEALKLDPRCSAALSGLARCYMQQGDPAAAETAADRALGIDPADEESAGVKAEIQAERRSAQPRQLSSMDSRATPAERGDFVPTVGGGPAPGFNDRDETTEANRSNCAVRLEPLEVPIVSTPHAGLLEGGSDRLSSGRLGLKPRPAQAIANIGLTEVSLGRTDTYRDNLAQAVR